METTAITNQQRNLASAIHLSTLAKWCFPLGNLILPLILWMASRKDSAFVGHHGKQALNFQLSLMLYGFILLALLIPVFGFGLFGVIGQHSLEELDLIETMPIGEWLSFGGWLVPLIIIALTFGFMIVADVALTLVAAAKSQEGEWYRYPFTINFIR